MHDIRGNEMKMTSIRIEYRFSASRQVSISVQ